MQLIPIGALSTLSQLSQRALRLYADEGLLPPARIDRDTGYRYYRLDQLPLAQRIRRLREIGLSLNEIRQLLDTPDGEAMLSRLQSFRQTQIREHRQRGECYRQLVQQMLEADTLPDLPVAVRARPAQWLLETEGLYTTEGMKSAAPRIFDDLQRHIASQSRSPAGPGFLAFPDPMLADTAGMVRFCVPVAEPVVPRGDFVLREDAAREEAFLRVGPEFAFHPRLLLPIEVLVRWMSGQGLGFAAGGMRYCWLPGEPAVIEISWLLG